MRSVRRGLLRGSGLAAGSRFDGLRRDEHVAESAADPVAGRTVSGALQSELHLCYWVPRGPRGAALQLGQDRQESQASEARLVLRELLSAFLGFASEPPPPANTPVRPCRGAESSCEPLLGGGRRDTTLWHLRRGKRRRHRHCRYPAPVRRSHCARSYTTVDFFRHTNQVPWRCQPGIGNVWWIGVAVAAAAAGAKGAP